MIRNLCYLSLVLFFSMALLFSCKERDAYITITVYPDSVLNDVSHHPVGINVDYFMDDDLYLKPSRRTADALKAMGVRYLRYPGGNKSDLYLFSVPPYEKAVPILARTGNGAVGYEHVIKDNKDYKSDVMDFDEFIALCREVDAEPLVVVAADEYLVNYPEGCSWTDREGLIKNAVEWVRYSNIKKGYNVKYWMIGNECWHKNNENSTGTIYARDVIDFSTAMKAIDPTIYIIPNGNSVDFFKDVLTIAAGHIDYLCLSNYPVWDYSAGYVSYRDTLKDLMGPVKRALTAIDQYASPADKEKLKLLVVEYGPFDWAYKWPMINDMGHNLCNFEMTGEQLKVPEIEFSCFWNTRWIQGIDRRENMDVSGFDALDRYGWFNANGYGLMIWGKFLGDWMVKSNSSTYEALSVFSSYSPENKKLFVYLLNKTNEPVRASIEIQGYRVGRVNQAWELRGKDLDDQGPTWEQLGSTGEREFREVPGATIRVIEYLLK